MRVSIEADADNPNITIIFSTTGCSQQDEPYCLLWWLSCTLKNRIVGCLTKIRSPSRILLSYLIEFNLWNQNFYPVEKAHNFYSIQFIYAGKFSISVTVFPTNNLQPCTLTAKVTTFATAIGWFFWVSITDLRRTRTWTSSSTRSVLFSKSISRKAARWFGGVVRYN